MGDDYEPRPGPRILAIHKGAPFTVAADLMASGKFTAVDEFDASLATPTAALLAGYDGALVYGDGRFDDSVLFGDRLKSYVDTGRGVVIAAMFVLRETPLGEGIDGQFDTANYFAIPETPSHLLDRGGDGPWTISATPGSFSHPILTGWPLSSPISQSGSDYGASRPYAQAAWAALVPGAVEVAHWNDDPAQTTQSPNTNAVFGAPTPFVVTRDLVVTGGAVVRRVDLGMRIQPGFTTPAGYGVVVNALLWVTNRI